MDTAIDASKKAPLEDLTKDELIKRHRSLLNILQQAKQSKKSLSEENALLKKQLENPSGCNTAAIDELIENLTQQKLSLVTNLDEVKTQKDLIIAKLTACEAALKNAEEKISDLDTEKESHLRQITRLTEENEQLLVHLDTLSTQSDELRVIGLDQQKQLLQVLEKKNGKVDENIDIEEKRELKEECETLKNISNELQVVNSDLTLKIEDLQVKYEDAQVVIFTLKEENREKLIKIENNANIIDDLNIELHKNKALVEKLQHDITTLNTRLSNNHIESTCIESDLLNANEKLKEKLKHLRSKIIKFANDVKILKQEKGELMKDFKINIQQIKEWETQLKTFTDNILNTFEFFEHEKLTLNNKIESLKCSIFDFNIKNESLEAKNNELKDAIQSYEEKCERFQTDKTFQDEISQLQLKLDSTIAINNQLQINNARLCNEFKILQDEHEKEKSQFQVQIEELKELQRSLNENYQTVLKDCNLQQSQIDTITSENSDLLLKLRQLNETKIDNNNEKIETLTAEISGITTKLNEKLQELQSLEIVYQNLQTENNNLTQATKELNQKCQDYSRQLETQNSTIHTLETELNAVKVDEVNNKTQQLNYEELKQQLDVVKNENSELLNEMNEMNQVLKERGEVISQQQIYCEDLLKKVQVENSKNNKLTETLREKEDTIFKLESNLNSLQEESTAQFTANVNEMHETLKKKDEDISNLQNELSTLKEKLLASLETSQDANYAESENMSTSTISKTEDLSRMKDLEGSWEEKYGKLRNFAIKLKGKVRDLSNDLSGEKAEKADIHAQLVSSIKSAQTLQAQCDKLQDELDQRKVDVKNYSAQLNQSALDISNNKKQLAENEELIGKLKNDVEHLNKEKLNTENWKKEISNKVQNLRKEVEAHNVLKKDFENQITKLNSQLEGKDKQLRDEIEKHNTTRVSLQELNNECKKQSVLNLEMQDYERGLKDVTQKLEKKQELITKLKNQIDSQRSSVSNVKEQNRLLENRIQHEETDLISARNEIQLYKKNIAELETLIIQKDDKILDITQSLESNRAENEDLATQLSKVMSDNQKTHASLKNEKEYLLNQNLSLEQKIRELEENLKIKEEDLQNITTEYQGYKVRAQSVLRQNQTRDIGLEEKLSEEIISLKAHIAVLQAEIDDFKNKLKQANEEKIQLYSNLEKTQKDNQDLQQKYDDANVQFENLHVKHQKTVSDNAETIRSLKLHSDTLSQCYRQQLSEQEVRHNREIVQLQGKIEKIAPPPPSDVPQLPPLAILREQGEGSDNVDVTPINVRPIPLDRLLSTEIDQDPVLLKKQISDSDTKVIHLTALLADTEQDLAKHVQMNELLKEEIRRQQRSVEREQHAENLEYLKNVIFKFATLTNGDEKSRLVPVLNTILKFSPDEMNKLNLVARGEYSIRSWANYLPTWSSTNKPQ